MRGNFSKFVRCKKLYSLEFIYEDATTRPNPAVIPMKVPDISPRHVFPSPRIRLPSRQFFPKSIGVPPPTRTALALAI